MRFLYAYPNKITGKLLETIAATREDLLLHRCAVAARLACGTEEHEAGRRSGYLPEVDCEDAPRRSRTSRCALRSSSVSLARREEEFEELCDFVREAQFDWMGVFGYSDQEGAQPFAHGQESRADARSNAAANS